jgi:hypothetical protein
MELRSGGFCFGPRLFGALIANPENSLEDKAMPVPPKHPKVYHITHVDNLPAIISAKKLISDARMIKQGGPPASIGMSSIKQRRLSLPVHCHDGDHVGEYVPFYFCSRSVMLYLLYRGNHEDLTYRGGQEPIVHLQADLHAVVDWANSKGKRWAFSLSNAGAGYTEFRDNLDDLDEINWPAVANNNFSSPDVKEGKQAEFLLYGSFPWRLVERIGVYSKVTAHKAMKATAAGEHHPTVEIMPSWYF